MAKEKWTVFYGQKSAGNQKPVAGWKEKELKVEKIGSATALEKNEPWVLAEPGTVASAKVQECYFVTVVAESAEEACLVVDRFLSQGLANSTAAATMEAAGAGGPSIKPFVNSSGKALACLSSNITEVGVL